MKENNETPKKAKYLTLRLIKVHATPVNTAGFGHQKYTRSWRSGGIAFKCEATSLALPGYLENVLAQMAVKVFSEDVLSYRWNEGDKTVFEVVYRVGNRSGNQYLTLTTW